MAEIQWSFFAVLTCLLTVFDDWYTVGTPMVLSVFGRPLGQAIATGNPSVRL